MSQTRTTSRWNVVQRPWWPDRTTHVYARDLVPGTLVQISNERSGSSFLATITTRREHRDFVTMLRVESIKDCLPDRDPDDLQRAVNVYHAMKDGTYKFIARKHRVVSLRFERVNPADEHVDPAEHKRTTSHTVHKRDEYERNSLCAIFDYVEGKSRYKTRTR